MTRKTSPQYAARCPPFGGLLASYRHRAGQSQLLLSIEAGISARHLSFMEVGRSHPSVDMVRRLAGTLQLAATERNALLLAAGYAPEPMQLHPAQVAGQHAFDVAVALAAASSADATVELASRALADLGIHHFITGTIYRRANRLLVERDLQGRPAVGWLRHMALMDYHDSDYLLAAAATRTRAFTWDDVRGEAMQPRQRRILDEAADYRIGGGFILPVHRPDGTVRAFSSWAERLSSDPATRTAATLVAHALLDALDRLAPAPGGPGAPDRLLPQHRDILLRVAQGSSQAAPALLEQATAVMGASCPATAASRALAMGLLN